MDIVELISPFDPRCHTPIVTDSIHALLIHDLTGRLERPVKIIACETQVKYSLTFVKGWLPVYATDIVAQAHKLLVGCCSTNVEGKFFDREVISSRDVRSLFRLRDKLYDLEELFKETGTWPIDQLGNCQQ